MTAYFRIVEFPLHRIRRLDKIVYWVIYKETEIKGNHTVQHDYICLRTLIEL